VRWRALGQAICEQRTGVQLQPACNPYIVKTSLNSTACSLVHVQLCCKREQGAARWLVMTSCRPARYTWPARKSAPHGVTARHLQSVLYSQLSHVCRCCYITHTRMPFARIICATSFFAATWAFSPTAAVSFTPPSPNHFSQCSTLHNAVEFTRVRAPAIREPSSAAAFSSSRYLLNGPKRRARSPKPHIRGCVTD
jgi:hypothetical protein